MTSSWFSARHILGLLLALSMAGGMVWVIATHQSTPESTSKIQVVGTFYPLSEFARQIGGSMVDISNVTPAGAEPHDYEPSSQQLTDLERADMVVYDGATFEPWIDSFLSGYRGLAVAASNGISLIATGKDQTDPHFWLDPVYAQKIVTTISNNLSQLDKADAPQYGQRANLYNAQLASLDLQFKNGLANCQLHTVVTSHDALEYMARRYGFSVESIAGLSPDAEPSPAKLAEIAQVIKTNHVPVVLFETLVSPKLADTLASETGAGTAVFNPLEGLTEQEQQQGADYISVQQQNLQALRKAMKCQ